MSTLLVPDTNVFVQFHLFDGLPWKEISGRADVTIVILAVVVRELDKLKLEPRVRDRVRDVLPRIEALFAEGDTGVLQDGTQVRFEAGLGIQSVMASHGLEVHLGDDRILATVLKMHEEGADVLVVTDDSALRLRARGLGLAVCRMPDRYRRPGADPLQAENAKLRRELDDVRAALPRPELQFVENGRVLKMARRKPSSQSRNRLHDMWRLQHLALDNLPATYGIDLERPTQAELDAYNKRLEAFRPTYENYVTRRDAFELFPYQSFALELVIRNGGGRPPLCQRA